MSALIAYFRLTTRRSGDPTLCEDWVGSRVRAYDVNRSAMDGTAPREVNPTGTDANAFVESSTWNQSRVIA